MCVILFYFFVYRKKINDGSKLSECSINNGTNLNLVILTPFDIYVQGVDGRNHTIYVETKVGVLMLCIIL